MRFSPSSSPEPGELELFEYAEQIGAKVDWLGTIYDGYQVYAWAPDHQRFIPTTCKDVPRQMVCLYDCDPFQAIPWADCLSSLKTFELVGAKEVS